MLRRTLSSWVSRIPEIAIPPMPAVNRQLETSSLGANAAGLPDAGRQRHRDAASSVTFSAATTICQVK